MRSKEVGVRLSVKDDGARKAFKDLGSEGDRALATIAREGREANEVLRQINASAQATRGVFDGLSRLKGGITGLVTGFVANAAVQQVRETARAVAEVGDAAKRAGLDLVAFQELKYVAEQNRIGVDQLVDGIKELNLRADEFVTTGGGSAAEAFQRLGYNAERLGEKLEDPSALFSEIVGKLQNLDRAGQIRVMDEIFGGSAGEQFVQLIDQGEQGIRNTIEAAHELGLVMSQDLVDQADNLDRKFQAVEATVGNGLKVAIVAAANALAVFIDLFQDVEDRTQVRPLQNELAQLYNDRFALGQQIEQIEGENWGLGEMVGARAATLDRLQAQFDAMTARADQLLGRITELQGRAAGYVPPAPAMDLPGGGANWDTFTSTFKPPRTSGARSSSASAADKEREKIEGVIRALRDELAALNMTAVEREVMNQLRRAGVEAASAEGQTIRGLVEELAREKDAVELIENAMENLGDTARDVLGTIASGLREGKEAAEIFADVTDQLISKLLSGGIDMGVNALTGWLGSLFTPGGGVTGGSFGNGLWGSAIFGQAHSGWKVGQGNPPQSRHLANLPRMHMGGLNRDEQMIVARKDETIFTPRQMDNAEGLVTALMRNLGQERAGGNMSVEIHNYSGEKVREERTTRPDGTAVSKVIIGEMVGAIADGRLDTVMGSTYGLKRKGA